MEQATIEFVKNQTVGYDESHDISHAIRVASTALEIHNSMEKFLLLNSRNIVYLSAMVHDIVDYKYNNEEECQRKGKFIEQHLHKYLTDEEITIVFAIINNISFSKEKAGKTIDLGKYQVLRDIVSDADKLDALGVIGLRRCFAFTEKLMPNASHDEIKKNVINHCHDKLLNLDKYIKTKKGKEIAIEKMKPIQNFVNSTLLEI